MIRCQRRQNSNSQQARKNKKNQVIFPFCKSFKELLSIVPYGFWMATVKLFHVIEQFLLAWYISNFLTHCEENEKKNIQVFLFLTLGSADKACCLTSQIISSLWNWRHFSTLSSGTPTRTRIKLDEVEEFSDKLSSISCPYVFRVILPWCWLSENRKFESIKI